MQLGSALYLTRSEDVSAHLIFAAAEIGHVVVSVGPLQVHGTISPPDPRTGQIYFSVDARLEDLVEVPSTGRSVRVNYEHEDSAYAFYSEMEGTDIMKRWVLQAPRTVERSDRRLVYRHRVQGDPEFSVQVETPSGSVAFPLFDVSSAGLSFTYSGSSFAARVGERFSARVYLPGRAQPMSLVLEIRNQRPMRDGGRITGCRFVAMNAAERTQIAQALAVWKHNRRSSQRRVG